MVIVRCPQTGVLTVPEGFFLRLKTVTSVVCPACGGRHLWDPTTKTFCNDASLVQRSSLELEATSPVASHC
jgi:hypothetical protein